MPAGDVGGDLVRVVAGVAADGAQRVGEQRLRGRPTPGTAGDDAGGAAGLAQVAADLGDRQPGRQRPAVRPAATAGLVDEQPGDGLAVLVQQPVRGGPVLVAVTGEQGARRDEAGDAGRRSGRPAGRRAGAGGMPASRSPAATRVAGTGAGAGQPAVRRRGARPRTPGSGRPCAAASRRCRARCGDGRRAARRAREAARSPSQGLENLSDNDVPGLRVFSVGNETCQARVSSRQLLSRLDPPPRVYLSA